MRMRKLTSGGCEQHNGCPCFTLIEADQREKKTDIVLSTKL